MIVLLKMYPGTQLVS